MSACSKIARSTKHRVNNLREWTAACEITESKQITRSYEKKTEIESLEIHHLSDLYLITCNHHVTL